MKNIHLTIVVSSLTIGGAEQLLLELARELDKERFRLSIFFLRDPGILGAKLLDLGVRAETNILRHRFDLAGIWRLTRLFRDEGTHVVLLLNHLNSLFFAIPAARMAGVCGVVNWVHEIHQRYPIHGVVAFLRRQLARGLDRVVAVAEGHREYVIHEEKMPQNKVVTIYNGVNPTKFRCRRPAAEAKKRLGLPPDAPTLAIIATLREIKNHDLFLRAAALIAKELPETRFMVVGDGPMRGELEALAHSLGIADQVHFLGFRRDMEDILAASDVKMLTSDVEMLSVAALEAMAACTPVVCTDVGYMDEAVIPGQTGFLSPAGDAAALSRQALKLLTDERLRQSMGDRGSALVEEKFTLEATTRRFESLFAAIVRKSYQNAS